MRLLLAFLSLAVLHAQTARDLDQRIHAAVSNFHATTSLYAENLDTGATCGFRENERVRTASTIKLAIMAAVFDEIARGRAQWTDQLTLHDSGKVAGSGVLSEFSDGMRFPIRDLVHLMIVVSDNTATNLLLDRFTADAVNAYMDQLGLKETRSLRKILIDGKEPSGHSQAGRLPENKRFGIGVSTPREMVTLIGRMERGELVSKDASREMIEVLKRQQYKDGIGRHMGDIPVASKSGSLDRLRSDVGIVYSPGGRIAIAITVDDLPSTDYSPDNAGSIFISELSKILVEGLAKPRTTAEDHQNMLDQLGIKNLRPGPSGNEKAPNHANYDESKANPFPDLPDPLTLKDGTKVTTAAMWWNQRRPEIVEDFEREVVGRIPKDVPSVTWTMTETTNATVASHPVIAQQLTGHVDNSSDPLINVDIQMTLVKPAHAAGPVPVMILFGRSGLNSNLTAPQKLIADGWAYAYLNPASIQADNGAGLTQGIIGLTNNGQWRKPDDWGALRAWAWGASRALDYLETDPAVDSKHVGIDGVSRYGKAALITMAFDTRFALVLVGSSGEGGAKLHRRNFGEAVENLTGSGEYHWMAGNFLKYGSLKNAGDLPVDAHELIALCAPRLTFISYGIPEKGDAKWLDHKGSFMAAVAVGPVFRLLGAKDLGTTEMPPVKTPLLNGQLAWRQHDGGHTDGPNWEYFIAWADKFIGHPSPADQPAPRLDEQSHLAHERLLEKARAGGVDIYFEGDSITRRWGATDYPQLLANWNQNFSAWKAADFGWGADKTQNILWRLENGELDGVNPKIIVLLAGTNNLGNTPVPEITAGLEAILRTMQAKAPAATIILTAIFPRYDNAAYNPMIDEINANLSKLADGNRIRFLNINSQLAGMMNVGDKLHPTAAAYQIWADALKPLFTEILSGARTHACRVHTRVNADWAAQHPLAGMLHPVPEHFAPLARTRRSGICALVVRPG